MRKSFVVLMTTGLVLTASSAAYADISPTSYDISGSNWTESINSVVHTYTGNSTSSHIQGTWNSPYTAGVDGFNYNDAQDYTAETGFGGGFASGRFTSGPHGGYLTSTHKCRECHAVHRAAGKFKLTRSDTRFEACDWCHGTGAGSGYNIQMDNNDTYTEEYNVGHTMGYGVSTGKWRAPDDTFPAYAPNYYLGGLSCFDCHSPHANPARMVGFNDAGTAVGEETDTVAGVTPRTGNKYGVVNPGHAAISNADITQFPSEPIYLSGSWLLIKNPDREMATVTTTVASGITGGANISITANQEIPDAVIAGLQEFDTVPYPVNKLPVDWDSPVGPAGANATGDSLGVTGYTTRNMSKRVWNVSEFCTDCHDGNAGLHTIQAPLFSEDRALRDQGIAGNNWKGNYDLAYGHDAQPRH